MSASQVYRAPPLGTLGHTFLKTTIMYINQADERNILELQGEKLRLLQPPKVLGRAVQSVIMGVHGERIATLDIPRTGNDNKEGVLGGILLSLGLSPKESIGRTVAEFSEILRSGASPPVLSPSFEAKMPSLFKVNYMEFESSFLHTPKADIRASALSVLLAGLGAILSYVARTRDGTWIYLLPGHDVETLRLPDMHRKLVGFIRAVGADLPETVKAVAVASIISYSGVDLNYAADEVHLQKGNRITVTGFYPYLVGSLASRLNRETAKLLKGFIEAASRGGRVRNLMIRALNYILLYLMTGNVSFKYSTLRELDSLRYVAMKGSGKDAQKVRNLFSSLGDPEGFIARLERSITGL